MPGSIAILEAERLGKLTHEGIAAAGPLEQRTVPLTPRQYEEMRRQYRARMAEARKGYIAEVAESKARYAAAAAEFRERVREKKAEADALKAVRTAARVAQSDDTRARAREAARLRADLGARRVELDLARVDEARAAWLKALMAQASTTWVPEGKIDDMITPELFSLKFAWQYAPWFEAKEKKRRMQETARRNKRPGQPLREVFLEGSDAEFEADWESEDEAPEGSAGGGVAGERPRGAVVADEDAAADATGATAAALTAARSYAAARRRPFAEPNFDAAGVELDETGDRVERMRQRDGITVQELAASRSADAILADYEDFLAATTGEGSSGAAAAAAVGGVDDTGERPAENVYIAQAVLGKAHEALYYALVRKRRRLAGNVRYRTALNKLDVVWGEWLAEVDALAAGQSAAAGRQAHSMRMQGRDPAAEARQQALDRERTVGVVDGLARTLFHSAGGVSPAGAGSVIPPATTADVATLFANLQLQQQRPAAGSAAAAAPASAAAAAAATEDATAAAGVSGDDVIDEREIMHAARLADAVDAVPVPPAAAAQAAATLQVAAAVEAASKKAGADAEKPADSSKPE